MSKKVVATCSINTRIGNKSFIISSGSDDHYAKHIGAIFDPHMCALFKAVASNSNVILDIGANIGCTTILFSQLAKTVFAFEPSPTTFHYLQKNITQAGLSNVFTKNIGLGNATYESSLFFNPSNRAGAFVSNKIKIGSGLITEKIQISQLDSVLKSLDVCNVDFIKIDVEGFEAHVLQGAKETLSLYKPIVILELNHWCLNAFQRTSIPDFFDFLRSLFPILLAIDEFTYLNLHDESDSYQVMHEHIVNMKYLNILAAFDENRLTLFKSLFQHKPSPQPSPSRFKKILRAILRKIL